MHIICTACALQAKNLLVSVAVPVTPWFSCLSIPQTANNAGMTVIYITHKVVKYLLPQWSLCVIFSPIKKHRAAEPDGLEETETLSWAEKPVRQSHTHSIIIVLGMQFGVLLFYRFHHCSLYTLSQ